MLKQFRDVRCCRYGVPLKAIYTRIYIARTRADDDLAAVRC